MEQNNQLQIFKNELFEVAIKLEDGEVVFDAEKVAECLNIGEKKNGKFYAKWSRINNYLGKNISTEVAKGDLIPESAVYKLAFKASNNIAEQFQDWLATIVIPTIRKTGGYIANADLMVNTYFGALDENHKGLVKGLFENIEAQQKIIQEKDKEIEYKENVIIGLVDEISLAEKRQILNRVVRKVPKYQERWKEIYKNFEMKYHINLNVRFNKYNETHKPKMKNKLDYIDKVMNKIPELYEIAVKLYENDVKELVKEIYELNN